MTVVTVVGVVLLISLLAVLLGAVIRFSVVSFWRTKGSAGRLRRPEPREVESICGFPPPPELIHFFTHSPFVERTEFELVDRSHEPPRTWPFGWFVPLTARDIKEARAIHSVRDGIPIAADLDKGVYVVVRSGAVVLRAPNVQNGEVAVAASIEEMSAFKFQDDVGIEAGSPNERSSGHRARGTDVERVGGASRPRIPAAISG